MLNQILIIVIMYCVTHTDTISLIRLIDSRVRRYNEIYIAQLCLFD